MKNYVEAIESVGKKILRLYSDYATPDELRAFKANIENDVFAVVRKTKPVVMFYGVYNAGKSTLVNAILGREAAAVSARPETSVVTPYDWNGFELWDSPGIDAPLDHEKLSKEKLRRCDLVLFVVSSEGTFESKKNYQELADLIRNARRFVIILNDKGGYDKDSDEVKLIIQKIFKNLVNDHGSEIAKKYSVVYVNAKSALKGRREGKKGLIEKSGIIELEERILIEVRSAGFAFLRFANALRNLLQSCHSIQERINQEIAKYSTEKVNNMVVLKSIAAI